MKKALMVVFTCIVVLSIIGFTMAQDFSIRSDGTLNAMDFNLKAWHTEKGGRGSFTIISEDPVYSKTSCSLKEQSAELKYGVYKLTYAAKCSEFYRSKGKTVKIMKTNVDTTLTFYYWHNEVEFEDTGIVLQAKNLLN